MEAPKYLIPIMPPAPEKDYELAFAESTNGTLLLGYTPRPGEQNGDDPNAADENGDGDVWIEWK